MAAWQKKKKAKRCFFERAIASAVAPLIINTVGKIFGKYLKKGKRKRRNRRKRREKIWKKKKKKPRNNRNPSRTKKLRKKQSGGWLIRHAFAYADPDIVNTGLATFSWVDPSLINKASNLIDKIAERRIWQVVQQGGKEIKLIAPK